MAKRIHNPHDLFLKATLSSPRAIQDFFQAHLPAHLRTYTDFSSIQLVNPHKVLPTLAELHPDFVFSCLIDNKLAFLFVEHQLTPDWLMPLRFAQYDTATTADYIKNESEKKGKKEHIHFPFILNFCFFHGPLNKPYPYSTNFYDYLPNAYLGSKLGMTLHVEFCLINLSMLPDLNLESHGTMGLLEKLFKYRNEKDLFQILGYELERCRSWILGLDMPAAPLGADYWQSIFYYASSVLDLAYVSEENLLTLFEDKLFINKEDIMRTIAQQIEKRVEERVEKRVVEREKTEIAKAMLTKGLSVDLVKEVTKLPIQTIDQLRKK